MCFRKVPWESLFKIQALTICNINGRCDISYKRQVPLLPVNIDPLFLLIDPIHVGMILLDHKGHRDSLTIELTCRIRIWIRILSFASSLFLCQKKMPMNWMGFDWISLCKWIWKGQKKVSINRKHKATRKSCRSIKKVFHNEQQEVNHTCRGSGSLINIKSETVSRHSGALAYF